MTAEIAIMNKSAVALAADSAVTFGTRDRQKIYNTVHKLFCLSRHHPVGAMIFGGAELMGVPWETIVKMYRRHLGKKSFPKLSDYMDDFIKFLEASKAFFPSSAKNNFVAAVVAQFYLSIRNKIKDEVSKALKGSKKSLTPLQIEALVTKIVAEECKNIDSRPDLPRVGEQEKKQLADAYTSIVEQQKIHVFEVLPLSVETTARLTATALQLFSKHAFPANSTSGIIFAGFGDDEIFPSLTEVTVDGVVADFLKYAVAKNVQVDRENSAAIIPFAQTEMVQTFMEGVNPSYNTSVRAYLEEMFDQYPSKLLNSIPRISSTRKKELLKGLQGVGKKFFQDFQKKMGEYRTSQHVRPIMNAMAALPKDELAAVAESLVNLTSFKRRFSMDAETVGGPIDVAVISKGDGFVWIKRKHYFRAELNPQYFSNYNLDYDLLEKGASNDENAENDSND